MTVVILESDTSEQAAIKIFEGFIVNQSCSVTGFEEIEGRVVNKGAEVLKQLDLLDKKNHFEIIRGRDGYGRRKRKRYKNQIGGYIAQKAFQFAISTRDGLPTTQIWRIQ